MEVVNLIGEGQHEKLYDTFNMQGYSDYVVVYLRLITSGQLQKDAEFYKHFIEGDRTVVEFCHQVKLCYIFPPLLELKKNRKYF